ncbi:MAG: hypothetical protein R3F61_36375 [Myxococcota bacterium]
MAKARFQVVIPPQHWIPATWTAVSTADPALPVVLDDAEAQARGVRDVYDLVYGALALLLEHHDLVEWALCLVHQWSVYAPPQYVEGAFNIDDFPGCMLDAIVGAHSVYLVNDLGSGATGAATGLYSEDFRNSDFLDGPSIPVNHPAVPHPNDYWSAHAQAYAAGGALGLCAVTAMAQTLLHEMMHMCTDGERDASSCWALQNMVAMSFGWAMAQRHPCLQGLTCCQKVSDTFFMSSEPLGDQEPQPFAWFTYVSGGC